MSLNYLAPSWEQVHPEWQNFLRSNCWQQLLTIDQQLTELAQHVTLYPPAPLVLRALSTAPQQTKVIILGQDPYHGADEANGLAFAVNPTTKLPPSLRNIFKELALEYGTLAESNTRTGLESWRAQGVMLLNASLSVIKDQANSLANIGWHELSDQIIAHLSHKSANCVFMLWGNFARAKKILIDSNRHLMLESSHPSPLAAHRGFLGCNHFRLANEYLLANGLAAIDWC